MDLQKLYFKALRWGMDRHPNSPRINLCKSGQPLQGRLSKDLCSTAHREGCPDLHRFVVPPAEHHRAFAAAVAQLCGDDPRRPLNRREAELMQLLKISGGPSVREHACAWAACRRGDAIQTSYEGMSAFYLDERFQMPGTWDFNFACLFCEPLAFGELTALHHEIWRTEPNCYDDFEGDLKILKDVV